MNLYTIRNKTNGLETSFFRSTDKESAYAWFSYWYESRANRKLLKTSDFEIVRYACEILETEVYPIEESKVNKTS